MNRIFSTDTVELRKLMVENGFYTISSLSKRAEINRNTLGKILDGSIQPSADVMYKLVIALNMTPNNAGEVFFAQNFHIA